PSPDPPGPGITGVCAAQQGSCDINETLMVWSCLDETVLMQSASGRGRLEGNRRRARASGERCGQAGVQLSTKLRLGSPELRRFLGLRRARGSANACAREHGSDHGGRVVNPHVVEDDYRLLPGFPGLRQVADRLVGLAEVGERLRFREAVA